MRGVTYLATAVIGACLLTAGCEPLVTLSATEMAATIPAAAAHPRRPAENLGTAMLQLACDNAAAARWHLIDHASVQPVSGGGQSVVYRIRGMEFDFERTHKGPVAIVPQGTDAGAAMLLASGAFVLPSAYCQSIFPQPDRRTAFLALIGVQATCRGRDRSAVACRALGAARAAVRRLGAALGKLG